MYANTADHLGIPMSVVNNTEDKKNFEEDWHGHAKDGEMKGRLKFSIVYYLKEKKILFQQCVTNCSAK
jgi:hypothetical protein